MNRNEINSLLKFVDKTRILFNKTVSNKTVDSDWKIFSFVITNHLDNKINTITSIIQASGLPFATGLRRVKKLINEKKLIQRTKTKSGKSFSIHPSTELIKEFTDYLLLIKKEIASNLGFSEINDNYFFGTSLSAGNIIRLIPLCVLHDHLGNIRTLLTNGRHTAHHHIVNVTGI